VQEELGVLKMNHDEDWMEGLEGFREEILQERKMRPRPEWTDEFVSEIDANSNSPFDQLYCRPLPMAVDEFWSFLSVFLGGFDCMVENQESMPAHDLRPFRLLFIAKESLEIIKSELGSDSYLKVRAILQRVEYRFKMFEKSKDYDFFSIDSDIEEITKILKRGHDMN
jgi:hypothetical protein